MKPKYNNPVEKQHEVITQRISVHKTSEGTDFPFAYQQRTASSGERIVKPYHIII